MSSQTALSLSVFGTCSLWDPLSATTYPAEFRNAEWGTRLLTQIDGHKSSCHFTLNGSSREIGAQRIFVIETKRLSNPFTSYIFTAQKKIVEATSQSRRFAELTNDGNGNLIVLFKPLIDHDPADTRS